MSRDQDAFFDKALRGWIVNTARKEHWRMPSWYSMDDLVQDGYLCYCKCREHYKTNPLLFSAGPPTSEQRRWFMALVQRAYYNHIMTLASRAALNKESAASQLAGGTESAERVLERCSPVTLPEGPTLVALAQLPSELVEVVDKLLQDGVDSLPYLRKKIISKRNKRVRATVRETAAERYTRLYGDLPKRLADYFTV